MASLARGRVLVFLLAFVGSCRLFYQCRRRWEEQRALTVPFVNTNRSLLPSKLHLMPPLLLLSFLILLQLCNRWWMSILPVLLFLCFRRHLSTVKNYINFKKISHTIFYRNYCDFACYFASLFFSSYKWVRSFCGKRFTIIFIQYVVTAYPNLSRTERWKYIVRSCFSAVTVRGRRWVHCRDYRSFS